ncbi:hypothetical protein [Shewanella sp.]|uniref:hypothetical protein n=1 Tax=Shewanella sp. TaxID=50422 RepID=UPI001ECA4E72|nr:hypothetical protein [Shewanella sp.]NRB26012.1 hypothetical protein [Shewanella sp.]
MKIKLFMRRYSNFSTVNLTVILIGLGYAILNLFNNEWTLKMAIIKLTLYFSVVFAATCVSFLPYDIFKSKKDKKLCLEIDMDYDQFSMLDEIDKDELRKKREKGVGDT